MRDPDVTLCGAPALSELGCDILMKIGMRPEDARFMAEIIVASDLAGHESHGMRRLPEYVRRWRMGKADPAARPIIDIDKGAVLRLDGRHGFGHVVVRDATDLAIERARQYGIAAVAIHRSEHAGRFADFCARAAEAGVITLFFANDAGASQTVAPPGGRDARYSTNPIAAGVPRPQPPHLVLDMATSTVAAGRLAEWLDRGAEIPAGWVNAQGALRPVGGVKGFGLALLGEALAGALSSAGTVSAEPPNDDQGVFLIAIDVGQLRPLASFTAEVESFIAYIKTSAPEPGAEPVRVPGESGHEARRERLAAGVPVRSFTRRRLSEIAAELGVAMPAELG